MERANVAENNVVDLQKRLDESEALKEKMTNEFLRLKEKYRNMKELVNAHQLDPILSADNEAMLHVLHLGSANDQTFIRHAILSIFKNSEHLLHNLYSSNRKVKAITNNLHEKNVIAPTVVLDIKNMFARRLRKVGLTSVQYDARMDKFPKMLARALYLIRSEYKDNE